MAYDSDLIYSFPSSYYHTFALTFFVSSFATEKMLFHDSTCALALVGTQYQQ